MADLKPHFKDKFLRKNDKQIVLVSTVHQMAAEFADKIPTLKTPTADEFLAGLSLDANNKLQAIIKIKDDEHKITLNRQSRSRRNIPADEVLAAMKGKLESTKTAVLENAVQNVRELTGKEEASYHMWSGLDLKSKLSIEERINILRPLINTFTEEKIHQVLDVNDCKSAFK